MKTDIKDTYIAILEEVLCIIKYDSSCKVYMVGLCHILARVLSRNNDIAINSIYYGVIDLLKHNCKKLELYDENSKFWVISSTYSSTSYKLWYENRILVVEETLKYLKHEES